MVPHIMRYVLSRPTNNQTFSLGWSGFRDDVEVDVRDLLRKENINMAYWIEVK